MDVSVLTDQRFTQADVLAVTRLKPELLQTWVNRKVVDLGEQNPGSGRRRLYSAIDIVKLALMRRIADLGLDLDVGRDFAAAAEEDLLGGEEIDWNLYCTIRRDDATQSRIQFNIISPVHSRLSTMYHAIQGDPRDMRVSMFVEPFEDMWPRRVRKRFEEERPIDPARRAILARSGIHAEPVVIFPFGEIVNATLLQVEALRGGNLPTALEGGTQIDLLERERSEPDAE